MKKVYTIILILLFLPFHTLFSLEDESGIWDPKSPSPFKIPQKLSKILKNYRKNLKRVTALEFSGGHWDQGIVVYVKAHDYEVFRHNYLGYLRTLNDDYECDEVEMDKEEIEEECYKFLTYPVGTIVVKENYLLEKKRIVQKPETVTVMIKREKGYDSQAGDWEYIQYDAFGTLMLQGNSKDPLTYKECAKCHANVKERDYMFHTFYLEEEPR